MKRIIFIIAVLSMIAGCDSVKHKKNQDEFLIKINNYTITFKEFLSEFKDSAYASGDTPESRKEFLNLIIRKKLILQDAQARGLDKDKEFLKTIERFWEQSLLKRAIDTKSREIASSVTVSDPEIEELYKKLQEVGKADKPYDKMYSQIKLSIAKAKESQIMNNWVSELSRKANIVINNNFISKKAPAQAQGANKENASLDKTK